MRGDIKGAGDGYEFENIHSPLKLLDFVHK